jgi:hypothetical protein
MRGSKFTLSSAVVLGAMIGAGQPAAASLIAYTSMGSFQAATTSVADVTFGGIVAPGAFKDFTVPPGYTDPATGTTFSFPTAPGTNINVTSATYYQVNFGDPAFPEDVLNSSSSVPDGASEMITLPASATAVGLFFSSFDTSPLTITLSNGDSFVDTTPPGFANFAFLGFTDTTPFSSLTITDPTSSGVLIGELQFGAAIPEPSSLALLGIPALLFVRRNRHS